MSMLKYRLVAILLGGACAVASGVARGEGDFQLSFAAGSTDAAGHFTGGTELRVLAVHGGRLYAGNGYWEDRPGPEGPQGAQILVLDGSGAHWRVEHAFDERMPNGRPRNPAVSALNEVGFATAGTGVRLPQPMSLLMASTNAGVQPGRRDGRLGGRNPRAGSRSAAFSAAGSQLRCAS
jgi:hypothetical protein